MYIAPCNCKNKKLKKKTKQQAGQQPGQRFQVGQRYNAPWCPRAMMEPLLMSSFFSLVMACLPPLGLAPPVPLSVPVLSPVVSPSSSASFVKPYFLNRFLLKVFTVRSLATLSGSEKESILSDVFKRVNQVTFKRVNSYRLLLAV